MSLNASLYCPAHGRVAHVINAQRDSPCGDTQLLSLKLSNIS